MPIKIAILIQIFVIGLAHVIAQDPQVILKPSVTFVTDTIIAKSGEKVLLEPFIEGEGPFFYKWYKDQVELEQGDKEYLLFSSISKNDAGSYRISVTNNYGKLLSKPVTLLVDSLNEKNSFLPSVRQITAESFEITFETQIGVEYQLQKSSDLINWLDTRDSILATKITTSFSISRDSHAQFFRIFIK